MTLCRFYVNIKFLVKELHVMSFHMHHVTLITAVIDGS